MSQCENCGNVYSKTFTVNMSGQSHSFDCFECAINFMAPRCNHCATIIIGHGVEAGDLPFCCASCARHEGYMGLHDHTSTAVRPTDIR
jgi:hypothetical protein